MARPERAIDPEDVPPDASSPSERPDWLVHAEQGAEDEAGEGAPPGARLSLHRPEKERRGDPDPDAERAKEPKPPKPVAWQAAASSVPRLREAPTARKAGAKQGPHASPSPDESLADDDAPEPGAEAGLDAEGAPDPEDAALARAQAALRPLDEPFWAGWLDTLRAMPAVVQVGLLVAVVAGAAFLLWPKADPGISIASMRAHAQSLDGREVKVRGVTGDVFPMAGGYVYNLQQGHEHVVVYAKGSPPNPKQWVTVTGTASVGYLDGAPRISIFEISAR